MYNSQLSNIQVPGQTNNHTNITTEQSPRNKYQQAGSPLLMGSPPSSDGSFQGNEYGGQVTFGSMVRGVPYLSNSNWKQEYLQRFNVEEYQEGSARAGSTGREKALLQ